MPILEVKQIFSFHISSKISIENPSDNSLVMQQKAILYNAFRINDHSLIIVLGIRISAKSYLISIGNS